MTQNRLAEILGVTPPQISRWEKGVNGVPSSRIIDIARALDVTPGALVLDEEDYKAVAQDPRDPYRPISIAPNAVPIPMEGASMERMREDLPIYGTALGAPCVIEGEAIEQTMLNTGDVVHYAKRPVILNGNADAYGLYVQGHSMDPVHIEGDLILAERKRPARIGDDVVVYLRPKDAADDDGERARGVLVKRLIRRTATYYELQQFNPAHVFRIDIEEVVRVDRVLRLVDLIT